MSPRWTKLLRDGWLERGRFAGMIAAITVSLIAVGTVLGSYAVLTREMSRNYLETHPADATIELGDDAEAHLARVRSEPAVARAEVGEVIRARFAVGADWRPILLFVSADPATQQLAHPHPVSGDETFGTLAVERTAADLFDLALGDPLRIRLADGGEAELPIGALVHDPGVAPAWQERLAYAYLSRESLAAALGRPVALHDLRVVFTDRADTADVEQAAQALAKRLVSDGATVHQIRVPPFERHPHQRQMTTLLTLLLTFAGMSLVLSAILVATSLGALLARQVREIGVMKTVGATDGQIAALYTVAVGAVGVLAVTIAVPIGLVGASGLSGVSATLLNFTLADRWAPPWVWAVQAFAGIVVPLATAAWPITRAARGTVRAALDAHGVGPGTLGPGFARWPRAVRSLLRRPGRLVLTLGLLASAGAMFVTARSVAASWSLNLAKIAASRFDDAEIRFVVPVPSSVVDLVRSVPGVARAEAWDHAPAAFAEAGAVDVARTWPDRGHGSLARIAVPLDTTLARYPLMAGRWFADGDTGVAVLDQGALAQRPGLVVGDTVELSVEGTSERLTVIGVTEVIGSSGAVYVPRTETGTTSMIRFATSGPAADGVRRVERALDDAPIDAVIPRSELELAVGGHIEILVQALTMMALVMAVVGGIGLATTTGIAVVERTREIGVLKTLGATSFEVGRMFVAESLIAAVASTVLAFLGAVPLILWVDGVVGRMGFLAPLPFAFSVSAALTWMGLVAVLSVLATLSPALRAGGLTVREALASV